MAILVFRKYHLLSKTYHRKVSPMKSIKVNFYPEAAKENAGGQCPVWVRSRHNADSLIRRATGYMIKSGDWSKKKNSPKDVDIKNQLSNLEKQIQDTYSELAKNNQLVNLADVWDVIKPKPGTSVKPKSVRVVDWIDHFIKSSPDTAGYVRGVKSVRLHLTGQYTERGKAIREHEGFAPRLTFKDLNQSKVDALCRHMADHRKSTGTILKVVKFLRQLAKKAADEGVQVASTTFKAPKNFGGSRKVKTEVRLTYAEIKKIADLSLPESGEKIVRDQFLLQCFSGLRWSDAARLTADDVHDNYIEIKQKKTGQVCTPTLGMYAKPIVDSYKAKAETGTSRLFPKLTQEYFNRTIKTIAEKAGIQDTVKVTSYFGAVEEISEGRKCDLVKSHTARRSFSRMLSLLGVSDQMISMEMGHLTQSLVQHYIGSPEHAERIRIVHDAWRKAEKTFIPPAPLQVERIISKVA